MCLRHPGTCLLVLQSYQFNTTYQFQISFHEAVWLFLFAINCLYLWFKLSVPFWQLSAGAWKLSIYRNPLSNFVFELGWLFPFAIFVFHDSSCLCYPGNCLLVIKNLQFTHNFISKSHLFKLSVCLWFPRIVFLAQHVSAIPGTVWWCLTAIIFYKTHHF